MSEQHYHRVRLPVFSNGQPRMVGATVLCDPAPYGECVATRVNGRMGHEVAQHVARNGFTGTERPEYPWPSRGSLSAGTMNPHLYTYGYGPFFGPTTTRIYG